MCFFNPLVGLFLFSPVTAFIPKSSYQEAQTLTTFIRLVSHALTL